ncbi:MAG: aminotransferase class V-fold PLP-dependent enzyme [Candidatus Obscuribacterales bacterium]
MQQRRIYLDNAATTLPKPEDVYAAHSHFLREAGNPGRGAHQFAMQAARAIHNSRVLIADLLGAKHPERLIFTPGCTYSLNMVIKGFKLEQGDSVVVSAIEHNAVMRPLTQLQNQIGLKVHTLPYKPWSVVDLHDLTSALLREKPKLCIISEASNVTGEIVDLRLVSTICQANRVPLVVDAAQTAGRLPFSADALGVAAWCASGHKGLMGPPGVGLLYASPDLKLEPIIAGGTGSHSEDLQMPEELPDRYEVGTPNGPAIAGLGAAAHWIGQQGGFAVLTEKEQQLLKRFLDWAGTRPWLEILGAFDAKRVATVSFRLPNVAPDMVASLLESDHGIAARSGLHCAQAAHLALGTLDTGAVRVSFGYFNKPEDVDALCTALDRIRG